MSSSVPFLWNLPSSFPEYFVALFLVLSDFVYPLSAFASQYYGDIDTCLPSSNVYFGISDTFLLFCVISSRWQECKFIENMNNCIFNILYFLPSIYWMMCWEFIVSIMIPQILHDNQGSQIELESSLTHYSCKQTKNSRKMFSETERQWDLCTWVPVCASRSPVFPSCLCLIGYDPG